MTVTHTCIQLLAMSDSNSYRQQIWSMKYPPNPNSIRLVANCLHRRAVWDHSEWLNEQTGSLWEGVTCKLCLECRYPTMVKVEDLSAQMDKSLPEAMQSIVFGYILRKAHSSRLPNAEGRSEVSENRRPSSRCSDRVA
jgi:hypothetical protein